MRPLWDYGATRLMLDYVTLGTIVGPLWDSGTVGPLCDYGTMGCGTAGPLCGVTVGLWDHCATTGLWVAGLCDHRATMGLWEQCATVGPLWDYGTIVRFLLWD